MKVLVSACGRFLDNWLVQDLLHLIAKNTQERELYTEGRDKSSRQSYRNCNDFGILDWCC